MIMTISVNARILDMIRILLCFDEKLERSISFSRIFLETVINVMPGTDHRTTRNIQPPSSAGSIWGNNSINYHLMNADVPIYYLLFNHHDTYSALPISQERNSRGDKFYDANPLTHENTQA